jgi:glycosyltransferase involved in cell wall biosynthesis
MRLDAQTARDRTAVVIPAFNAARHLESVIGTTSQFIPLSRIVVVDDGSTDDTRITAERTGAVVLKHAENCGKGVALNTGILAAGEGGAEYVITMDADEQHDPSEIPSFIDKVVESGADIVVGNRMANKKNMPGDRVFANRATSWFVSTRTGIHVPDSQNGYRLIRIALYKSLRIKARRYDAESELLIRAAKAGAKIDWVAVDTIYGTEVSSVHPVVDTLRFLRMAIRSLFW